MRQSKARPGWRWFTPFMLGIFLMTCASSRAQPTFKGSDLAAQGPDVLICDLDGDGLKDLVVMDDLKLSIFYQDRTQGFTREPQQTHLLEHRPCVVWAAKLGGPAESLLVMTSDGVSELCFTNRTGPPTIRKIIRQPTMVPEAAEGTNAVHVSLSAATGGAWPLLLLPAADGIHVWQHRDGWVEAQVLGRAIDSSVLPSLANPGYTNSMVWDFSVADVNHDGRDDLMLVRDLASRTNNYCLYLQQTNGLFPVEPTLTYVDKAEPYGWLGWNDLNRDGKVDLIKSVWLKEPSFLPGLPSGKVVVKVFMADEQGRIPAEPQQVFRKNDWTEALPVVDLDGDGFPDLVLGYCKAESRDDISKEISSKLIDYNLKFYFNRAGGGFPPAADCQRDVAIHVDRAASILNVMSVGRSKYFARYVRFDGDFNGDGKADLQVRERSDEIAVYFFVSRETGFSLKPDLRFSCPEEITGWEVADLNNDGVSDVIARLGKQKGYRVFMSQK